MVQTRQPHRLAAGKWLGVLDPDHVAPEPGSIADRVNHSRLSGRLVVHQLRSIAPEGLALRFELVGNVNQQAGHKRSESRQHVKDLRDRDGMGHDKAEKNRQQNASQVATLRQDLPGSVG